MKRGGFLMMEVAVVLLVTAVIGLFLFRGYALFARSSRAGAEYMRLALRARQDYFDRSAPNADNPEMPVADQHLFTH